MAWISEQASTLLAQFGSPLYVYDAALIEKAFQRFRSAFRYEPLECHYAIVCNKNHYIVRLLSELGAGIHANTPGDAYAASRAGVLGTRNFRSSRFTTRASRAASWHTLLPMIPFGSKARPR